MLSDTSAKWNLENRVSQNYDKILSYRERRGEFPDVNLLNTKCAFYSERDWHSRLEIWKKGGAPRRPNAPFAAMCCHHRYLFPVLSRISRCQNAQKAQGRLLLSSRQEVYVRRSRHVHVHVRTHVRVNVGHFTFNNSTIHYITPNKKSIIRNQD